jgi:mitochondrial fission protein ELM1
MLAGKYRCQGCLWCLRNFLQKSTYNALIQAKPEIVISCGSSLAPINYVLTRENNANSIVINRPSVLGLQRFNLVIMARHDNPYQRKNVVITEGALNLVDEAKLPEQAEIFKNKVALQKELVIGLLLGGDTKRFTFTSQFLKPLCTSLKLLLEKKDAELLVTTSRRTNAEVANLIKEEFADYPRCKFLVIANERNIPQALEAILGLSSVIIVSGESISMVSEAASAGRYVIVFHTPGGSRHRRFLHNLASHKYIYLSQPAEVGEKIEELLLQHPPLQKLNDRQIVKDALCRLI